MQKQYSTVTVHIKNSRNIYSVLMAILACLFFFVLDGFRIRINLTTFGYAISFAILIIASIMCNLFVLNKVPLAKLTLFSGGGALIIPYVFDILFLNGEITVKKTAAVFLLLFIFVMPFFDKQERSDGNLKELLYCALLFFVNGPPTIVMKLYTQNANNLGDNMFCLWGNLFSLPVFVALLFIYGKPKDIVRDFTSIGLKSHMLTVGSCLASFVATLIQMYVMSNMNITVYTILTSSLSLLLAAAMSAIIFRENIDKRTIVGIILSIAAIILSAV